MESKQELTKQNSSVSLASGGRSAEDIDDDNDDGMEVKSEKENTSRSFWRGYSSTEDIIGMAEEDIPTDYTSELPDSLDRKGLRWLDYICFGVTVPSLVFCIIFVLLFAVLPSDMQKACSSALTWIGSNLGWFYVLVVALTVLTLTYLLFSIYGDIVLGDDDDVPEFSTGSWLAMLFSAGMGVGMVFYGVGEPLSYYVDPPISYYSGPMQWAVPTTLFHWGISAWSIYCGLSLALSYFTHRLKLPLTFRSAMYPLLGRFTAGWPGHIIDTVAVFGTIGGLCTSLGLGVINIIGGLDYVFDIKNGDPTDDMAWLQVVIVLITTVLACISITTGLSTGVRILSNTNAVIALFLCFLIFVLCDPIRLLRCTVENLGLYVETLIHRTWRTGSLSEHEMNWMTSWTVFYWGWFFSWAPFVSIFIARISKGRTIRQFIVFVLGAPTMASVVWFTVMGQAAIDTLDDQILAGADHLNPPVDTIYELGIEAQIYGLLKEICPEWLYYTLSVVTMILLLVFFVTSSDSGTLVIDTMACGGQVGSPRILKCVWCVATNACALVLLISGGSDALVGLQACSVIIGLPVSVAYIFIILGLLAGLARDPFILSQPAPIGNGKPIYGHFTYRDVWTDQDGIDEKGHPRRATVAIAHMRRSFVSSLNPKAMSGNDLTARASH
ncbi:hypothetical protein SARC_00206 [Sphaeroforma arctica JP610]|uniref:Choline/carnitine/betaine transporter n=1 Tax=Sphaeroforma arctica JP610 TaxID=667725 RepID=A0A0L0GF80_9EUKA|nr:hypothetical protein SARC_00206 [Sphaeroforma arctica JP610]KNC87700.1 hypothetical protein SARC_00206 [Sphaeroforma arctica JP610]|eukprot:XP_014161602.1 hypothetical protein SARC_00206 [Sphaeroforma arctica JP610]